MKNERKYKLSSALDMLYLSFCAVKGETPKLERLKNDNLSYLFTICKFHSLTALVYEALKQLNFESTPENEEALEKFLQEGQQSIRRTMVFDAERSRLTDFLEEKGIWYMPLKGVVLKDFYPQYGLRQMSDNDILFDGDYRSQVKDWFVERNYNIDMYDIYNHDVYTKPPIYNFEMHVDIYSNHKSQIFYDYYKNIKSRLIKDDNNNFGFHFSDEDFYIYLITHCYKHYSGSGAGLRYLIDQYIYYTSKKETLNLEYIKEELHKLEIADFENNLRQLTEKIGDNIQNFSSDILTKKERELLYLFLSSGTYGTLSRRIENNVNKTGKFGYILNRLFPKPSILSLSYPIIKKHKWLTPICWVRRAFNILFTKPKKIISEFRAVIKAKPR